MNTKELALQCAKILDEKLGQDIIILDVEQLTSITDYFVIVTGRNQLAVQALAEDLEDKLAESGIEPRRKEGGAGAKWVVLDYAGVIVHIFHPEEREYYNIERLWSDGTNQVEFNN